MKNMIFLQGEELEHVWKLLGRSVGDCEDECPDTGEVWQYMGSWDEPNGVRVSQFRHRSLRRWNWKSAKRALVTIRQFNRGLPHGSWNAETVLLDYDTQKTETLHALDMLVDG